MKTNYHEFYCNNGLTDLMHHPPRLNLLSRDLHHGYRHLLVCTSNISLVLSPYLIPSPPNMAFINPIHPCLFPRIHTVPSRRPRRCPQRRTSRTRLTVTAEREDFFDEYNHATLPSSVPSDAPPPERYSSGDMNIAITTDVSAEPIEDITSEDESEGTEQGSQTDTSEDGNDAEEICVGDFMWSASLQEYQEQRETGLIASPVDEKASEWEDVWMLGVTEKKGYELRNQYSRVGILIARNFTDFEPAEGCEEAYENATLEEISLVKARAVYEATGLPAIAETSDLFIEPPESGSRVNKTLQQGYYTRKVHEEADVMIDRVRPISDETRITQFNSCVVYYDGEIEIVKRGTVDVAITFSGLRYATIATTAAMDELYKELTRRFRLVLDNHRSAKNGNDGDKEGDEGKVLVGATLLKERILRDGKMLNEGIIKVSAFMNHMVDTDLMEVCGEELAERLRQTMPNKVLTVESTGLIVGLPTARKLGIPLVFARKSRPITISDSYQTTYRSATKGTTSELIVSCEYLKTGDRVLIIDDFLAGGSTAEALFKLARLAHAKVVGVGVLIEKMSDGGRAFLSGYDVPVESLAKLLPAGDEGRIQFVEEEPWVSPLAKKREANEVKEEIMKSSAEYYARVAAVTERDGTDDEVDDDDDEDGDVDVIRWEEDEIEDDRNV